MGSMITLRLGRLEVDWGKNAFFRNHSPLFDTADLAEAEYFYADGEVVVRPAYVRKLSRVIPRLGCSGSAWTAAGRPMPRRFGMCRTIIRR